MDLNEYKKVKAPKLTEKDKVLILGFVFLIIIAVILFLHFDKSKLAETEEAEVKVTPGSPEPRKELSYAQNGSFEKNSISFVEAKMITLQSEMIAKGQTSCASELGNVIAVYGSDKTEALSGLSSVTNELLKFNINFLFPGSARGVNNYINFAAKKRMITKSDKIYLLKLKNMNNINCLPALASNAEQVESDLYKGLLIIENLI